MPLPRWPQAGREGGSKDSEEKDQGLAAPLGVRPGSSSPRGESLALPPPPPTPELPVPGRPGGQGEVVLPCGLGPGPACLVLYRPSGSVLRPLLLERRGRGALPPCRSASCGRGPARAPGVARSETTASLSREPEEGGEVLQVIRLAVPLSCLNPSCPTPELLGCPTLTGALGTRGRIQGGGHPSRAGLPCSLASMPATAA